MSLRVWARLDFFFPFFSKINDFWIFLTHRVKCSSLPAVKYHLPWRAALSEGGSIPLWQAVKQDVQLRRRQLATAAPFQLRRQKQHDPAAHSECHQNKSFPLLLNGKLIHRARFPRIVALASRGCMCLCHRTKSGNVMHPNKLMRTPSVVARCYDSSRNFHGGGRGTEVRKGLLREGKNREIRSYSQ